LKYLVISLKATAFPEAVNSLSFAVYRIPHWFVYEKSRKKEKGVLL